MKHIFTVHSPITFFAAYCVIIQESLPEKDVFIMSAGYTAPLNHDRIISAYQDQERSVWAKVKNFNLPKAYERFIDKLTNGQPFIAYIDLMHAYQRILITHPKCVAFHFIEEGTASYMIPDDLVFLTKAAGQVGFRNKNLRDQGLSLLRVLRGINMRLLSLPYHPQAYTYLDQIRYYTFSPEGYPGVLGDKKVILNPKSGKFNQIIKLATINNLNNEVIWVEESFPWVFGIKDNSYIQAINSMARILETQGCQKVYLKLRPNSEEKTSLLCKTLQEANIQIEILAKEAIAEVIFITSSNLTVIGLVSSLLYYAAIWGHKAISFLNFIENRPSTSFDRLDFFWKKVQKINS